MMIKGFENRLNTGNVKFNSLNPVWDNCNPIDFRMLNRELHCIMYLADKLGVDL